MKTTLRSQDLSCPSCIAKIEKALNGQQGVSSAKVFFNSGKIVVEHEDSVQPEKLVEIVRSIGYESKVTPF